VHYVVLVHILYGWQTLAEEFEGFGFAQPGVLVLVVEQSAILSQFHDHIDGFVLDEGVPEFDDVRVVDCRVQVDFPLQQKYLILAIRFAQIDLVETKLTTLTA